MVIMIQRVSQQESADQSSSYLWLLWISRSSLWSMVEGYPLLWQILSFDKRPLCCNWSSLTIIRWQVCTGVDFYGIACALIRDRCKPISFLCLSSSRHKSSRHNFANFHVCASMSLLIYLQSPLSESAQQIIMIMVVISVCHDHHNHHRNHIIMIQSPEYKEMLNLLTNLETESPAAPAAPSYNKILRIKSSSSLTSYHHQGQRHDDNPPIIIVPRFITDHHDQAHHHDRHQPTPSSVSLR